MAAQRTIELQHARQLNITRQHLDGAARPTMLDVIRDLGCLQLDPISAVQRSHLLVLWSRLGHYETAEIDTLIYQDRALFEYWAHEASIVLTEDYPLHQHRMAWYPGEGSWGKTVREWMTGEAAALREAMLARFRDEGALPARAFENKTAGNAGALGWTSGGNVSAMLQNLWHAGEIGVARREGIQRVWDLAERCLPDWTPRETWTPEQITQTAAQKAIRALGVAQPNHIKIHFIRARYHELPAALTTLVAEGKIESVTIANEGQALPGAWYIHTADLALLERIQAGDWQPRTVLLSPFDNLICDRKRLKTIFDFDYTIEIYVPQAKRQYGYYVLPILQGDRLIGRMDMRYERARKTLVLHAVYAEGADQLSQASIVEVCEAVKGLAAWLGAKAIEVKDKIPTGWENLRTL